MHGFLMLLHYKEFGDFYRMCHVRPNRRTLNPLWVVYNIRTSGGVPLLIWVHRVDEKKCCPSSSKSTLFLIVFQTRYRILNCYAH